MSVLSKMMKVIKGDLNNVGQAIIDSQAIRILDQEIRTSSEELKQSKDSFLELLAGQKASERKSKELREAISEHEDVARKALDQNDNTLALELATQLSNLQSELECEEKIGARFSKRAEELRIANKAAERNIAYLKQQLDTVKATDNVKRAQAVVSKRHKSTKLRTAMNSLERIKERQSRQKDEQEKEEASLEKKLEAAGIKLKENTPEDILDRLKKRKD